MSAQDPSDLNAIEQTARDYIEGWYECDEARAVKALHPELVKRFIDNHTLHNMGAGDMLNMIRTREGAKFTGDRQIKITVLDVFNDVAAVKVESAQYQDYVHVGKFNGQWMIVNVLWGFK